MLVQIRFYMDLDERKEPFDQAKVGNKLIVENNGIHYPTTRRNLDLVYHILFKHNYYHQQTSVTHDSLGMLPVTVCNLRDS